MMENIWPFLKKVAETVAQQKICHTIYIKAQFACPKNLHKTAFET
jgi:hypothetical protein